MSDLPVGLEPDDFGTAPGPGRPNVRAFPSVWLFLDGVENPGNIGGILRTADAFGIRGVVVSGVIHNSRRRRLGRRIVNPAKGGHHWVEVLFMPDPAKARDWLADQKKLGARVLAMTPAGQSLSCSVRAAPGDHIVYVLGNEGSGVSQACLDLADEAVSIPMLGRTQSLNVSVAAAVTLYEGARCLFAS